MSNPCSNCHSAPYTGPKFSDQASHENCSAREYWPPHLKVAQEELRQLPQWVRQNYAATQLKKNPELPPFSLDIPQADLEIHYRPPSLEFSTPWYVRNAKLEISEEGSLSSHLKIRDNEIPLLMQSLLKFTGIQLELPGGYSMEPDRISVGDYGLLHFITKVPTEFYEDVTTVDDFNWTFPFNYTLLRYIQDSKFPLEFYFPSPQGRRGTFPLGREQFDDGKMCLANPPPHPHNLDLCCERAVDSLEAGFQSYLSCLTPDNPIPYCQGLEYPHPIDNPKLDFGISRAVPTHLRAPNGRLPYAYDLNELMARVLKALSEPGPAKKPFSLQRFFRQIQDKITLTQTGSPPESLWELVGEGEATLDISQLKDLYIPGVLDLGLSKGRLHVKMDGEGIQLQIPDLDIQLDPMDYPAQESKAKRPPIRLHSGRITPGVSQTDATGYQWEPGIRAEYNPETGELLTQVNLRIQLDISLPLLGRVQIDSPILLHSSFKQAGRWKLVPGKNTLLLPHLQIKRAHPKAPLHTDLNLIFSDEKIYDGAHYLETSSPVSHFNLSLSGTLGNGKGSAIELDGFLPMTRRTSGYDWQNYLEDFEWNTQLKLKNAGGTQSTSFAKFTTFKPHPMNSKNNGQDFGLNLDLDVLKGERTWEEEEAILQSGQIDRDWMVDGGHLQFSRVLRFDGKFENHLWGTANGLRLGPLALEDVDARINFDQINVEEGLTEFTIPRFSIRANPNGSEEGALRGKIQAELETCTDIPGNKKNFCQISQSKNLKNKDGTLTVLWNQEERQLTFENLNLVFSAMGAQIPKILKDLQKSHRRERHQSGEKLSRSVGGIGMDGRIMGHFDFNFEDFKGQGDLRILGDRDGDIYFHSPEGKRIQPPLLKLTQWRFRRFDQFLFEKGYAYGAFRLFTRADTNSLRKFGYSINYVTDVIMGHRDVVIKPGGIDQANLNYYRKLYQEVLRRGGLEFLSPKEEDGP